MNATEQAVVSLALVFGVVIGVAADVGRMVVEEWRRRRRGLVEVVREVGMICAQNERQKAEIQRLRDVLANREANLTIAEDCIDERDRRIAELERELEAARKGGGG